MDSEKKILLVVGDGIGNQAQTIPAAILCKQRHGRVSIYNSVPVFPEATKVLFRDIADEVMIYPERVDKSQFNGEYRTHLCANRSAGLPLLGKAQTPRVSEVESNLISVMKKGDTYPDVGGVLDFIEPKTEMPDVILHDGYSKVNKEAQERWIPKSYPQYAQLAAILKSNGLSVGCIGRKDEYIEGTIDLTGLKLEDSIAAMKGCKLFIANDTGTYHIANLIGIPNVVIFTFTNIVKNYDKRFHRYATVIAKDLACSPCQSRGKDYWIKNKQYCKWQCRSIDPQFIAEQALGRLK
jgi:hypothetical protein